MYWVTEVGVLGCMGKQCRMVLVESQPQIVLDQNLINGLILLRQLLMSAPPLTIKGYLPKSLLAQDTFRLFVSKIDDLRKVASTYLQYLLLVQRGLQYFNVYLTKQSEILISSVQNDINDDTRYYFQLIGILQLVGKNFEIFDSTFESNLKEYHLSTAMEIDQLTTVHIDGLMNSYKKYKALDDSLHDSAKKWHRSEKLLSQSIKSYNDSFSNPRLAYNKEQINKRYSQCESMYHNTVQEEVNLLDKTQKIGEVKKSYVDYYNSFLTQFPQSYEIVNEKIILEAKRVLDLFCNAQKMIVSDIATHRALFEQSKIQCFLFIVPDMSHQKQCFNISTTFVSQGKLPIFLETPESIKDAHLKIFSKWLTQYGHFLKECSENNKKTGKKIYSFVLQLMKTIEKMSSFVLKQVPACYQKMKKKMGEVLGANTLEFIKCIGKTIEASMKRYQKLAKQCYQKLEIISSLTNQGNKITEMFFKQYNKQVQLYISETKLLDSINHKKQIREAISQRTGNIKYCLNSFGDKLYKNNSSIKTETGGVINQLFAAFNEIFVSSSEYQLKYFDSEFNEKLKKVRKGSLDLAGLPGEMIPDAIINQQFGIVETQRFKYSQFIKIKKADWNNQPKRQSITELKEECPVTVQSVISELKRKVSLEDRGASTSLDPKEKKNFQFIRRKIEFEEGEVFVQTFSCALQDKILLQGKLYLTTERLCFHSYFNAATLFFGGTFLQIPKQHIIKAEKKLTAKIFDNCIEIKTVNGIMSFASFSNRDEAYKTILKVFGLKQETPKEQEEESLGDQGERIIHNSIDNQQQHIDVLPEPDDISAEELKQRQVSLKEVLVDPRLEKKCSYLVKDVNCVELLRQFWSNAGYTTPDGRKLESFFEYLKLELGEKEIVAHKWVPSIEEYLNKNNIKKDTPLKFQRKASFHHILPKSSIPFMPKFCGTEQDDRLTIVSADRFFIDFRVTSQGIPYADTFVCYTRQEYTNTAKGVEVTASIFMDFVKKSMFQGVIHKQALKDLPNSQEIYVKLLNKLVSQNPSMRKLSKKAQSSLSTNPNSLDSLSKVECFEDDQAGQSTIQQQANSKYQTLFFEHQKLKNKCKLLLGIIILLGIGNILQLIL